MQRFSTYGDVSSVLSNALSNAFINNYSTIEIRSQLTPPVTLNVSELLDNAPPSAFSKFLQPTVILTDTNGQKTTIAPYGVAQNGSVLPGLGVVGVLLGIGFLCGRFTGRR